MTAWRETILGEKQTVTLLNCGALFFLSEIKTELNYQDFFCESKKYIKIEESKQIPDIFCSVY